jgi:uncharacterized membrane protein
VDGSNTVGYPIGMKRALRTGLTLLLGVAFVGSAAGVVYVATDPPPATETHTEFYVLGPNGTASDYPTDLSVGASGSVTVGVVNHEHTSMSYSMELRLGNRTVRDRTLSLADDRTWERELEFTAEESGRTRLSLLLYRGGSSSPYRTLGVWIDVTQ